MRKLLLALLLALSVLCWAGSQEITHTESNPLEKSLSLINDTILLVESIQTDNESLKNNNESLDNALENVSDMLRAQGQLLNEQAKTQAEQSRISERQAIILGKELKKGKILKWSLIVSVPAFTGLGMWLGWKLSR